jgi:hypothetical protein
MNGMRSAACLLLLGALAGCGGGGGGGGSNQPAAGAFTLSGNSASFSALEGDIAPPSTSLTMTITGPRVALVGAGVGAAGTAPPPNWLGINFTGRTPTVNVVLSINTTNMAPGQYTSTFLVATVDAESNILQSQQVSVNYTVTPRLTVSGNAYSSTFIYGDTSTGEAVPLAVNAANKTWTATSNAAWLQVPAPVQNGTGTIDATVDVSALTPGQYQGLVTITNSANSRDVATRSFAVTVQSPVLSITQQSILLGGTDGLSNAPQSLSFTLTSGAAAHPFVITPTIGGNWLDLSATSGLVGAAGTTVQVEGVRGSLTGASYIGEIRVTATVRNLAFTQFVPVTYNVEANRIVVGAAGVGFSSSPAPARSVLTRDVVVFSAIDRDDVPWQASSNAPWLSATSAGETGDAITLTANPTGLAAGTTHFATVTVTSPDPQVENEETIRVGLHVNSAAPTDFGLTVTSQYTATSPVEPIVFVNNGGSTITGYNVYNGAVARTFASPVANAGAMVVGADGRHLYVYDRTNVRVTELDAVTGALWRHHPSAISGGTPYGGGLTFFRPAGYSILVTPSARMYDLDTNILYENPQFQMPVFSVSLTSSVDSSYLVNDAGTIYRMRRTALSGGNITAQYVLDPGTAGGRAGQACISADNEYVYTASGAPYDFRGTSIATGQLARVLPGTNYPNAMLCLWNGVLIGGVDGYYYENDIFIYDGPSGQELGQLSSSGPTTNRSLMERGLAASADATRLISQPMVQPGSSSAYELRFQSLPAEL